MQAVENFIVLFRTQIESIIDNIRRKWYNEERDGEFRPFKLNFHRSETFFCFLAITFTDYGYVFEPFAMQRSFVKRLNDLTQFTSGEIQGFTCMQEISKQQIRQRYPNHLLDKI